MFMYGHICVKFEECHQIGFQVATIQIKCGFCCNQNQLVCIHVLMRFADTFTKSREDIFLKKIQIQMLKFYDVT